MLLLLPPDEAATEHSLRMVDRPMHDVNRTELAAIYLALCIAPSDVAVALHTDSACCLDMLAASSRSGGAFAVLLDATRRVVRLHRAPTTFHKVKAHSGVWGNEEADRLAKIASASSPDAVPTVWLPDDPWGGAACPPNPLRPLPGGRK